MKHEHPSVLLLNMDNFVKAPELLECAPFCYYCEREWVPQHIVFPCNVDENTGPDHLFRCFRFDDVKTLIQHQRLNLGGACTVGIRCRVELRVVERSRWSSRFCTEARDISVVKKMGVTQP